MILEQGIKTFNMHLFIIFLSSQSNLLFEHIKWQCPIDPFDRFWLTFSNYSKYMACI